MLLLARRAPGLPGAGLGPLLQQMREREFRQSRRERSAGAVCQGGGSRSWARVAVTVSEGWAEAQEVDAGDPWPPGAALLLRGLGVAWRGLLVSPLSPPVPPFPSPPFPPPLYPSQAEAPRWAGSWCTLVSAMFGWVW